MLRLIYCLRRRSDLSPGAFRRYWLEEHGPRVRERMGALGVRRYVQLHALSGGLADAVAGSRGGPPSLSTVWPRSRSTMPTP